MGCSASKMEPGEGVPAGIRPVRRRIEDITRWRRVRKGSISTAELLRPEDLEAAEDENPLEEPQPVGEHPAPEKETAPVAEDTAVVSHQAGAPLPEADATTAASEAKEATEVQEEAHLPACDGVKAAAAEEGKKTEEADEKEAPEKTTEKEEVVKDAKESEEAEGRKLGSAAVDEEELPGSPSLRFYFIAAADDFDDDSIKAGLIKKDGNHEKTKSENTHARGDSNESSTSSEESDLKVSKKKGKRFKVLSRAPSAVYSLLNVRNCYNNNSTAAAVVAVRESSLLNVRNCYNNNSAAVAARESPLLNVRNCYNNNNNSTAVVAVASCESPQLISGKAA